MSPTAADYLFYVHICKANGIPHKTFYQWYNSSVYE